LGWPTLSKFKAIPHYTYLFLKMPGPCGVISIRGDVNRAIDCDRESCETTDRMMTFVEFQELKQTLAESPPGPIMSEAETSKMSIQLEDTLSKMIPLSMEKPSKVAHIGNNLDPK
jgi:hypothetical protein